MTTFYRLLFFALGVLLFPFAGQAQDRSCQTMDYLELQLQENPLLLQNMEQIERFTQEFIASGGAEDKNATYTIPVVVHVIYNNSTENISDAQVLSQITVLNQDFRRTNGDADNIWSQAADTQIEFCLATVDPDGNPTNGITRTATGKSFFRLNDDMKKSNKGGKDPWPADQYLNIWVCDLQSGYLGYAQFPGGSAATDGVVIDYAYYGTGGTATAPFDLGRTGTHEVGHWLNLRHIWGDGPCSADDFVSDTPLSDGANYGCALGHISCSSVDMVQNYMDYSDDACMNLFTAGQSARMHAVLAPGGARASLASSPGCGGGGTTFDCPSLSANIGAPCNDGDPGTTGDVVQADCTCAGTPTTGGGGCDAPTGLSSTPRKNGREAVLSWNSASGANDYLVELRQQGASSWSSGTTASTSIVATGLTNGLTYEWRVTSNCTGTSATSPIATFIAGQSARTNGAVADLRFFPNPTRDLLYIDLGQLPGTDVLSLGNASFSFEPENFQVVITDLTGRIVSRRVIEGASEIAEINVSNLQTGLYIVKLLNSDGELQRAGKVMISR